MHQIKKRRNRGQKKSNKTALDDFVQFATSNKFRIISFVNMLELKKVYIFLSIVGSLIC